jgi:NitT/TauT family transport system substrate-binding protein
MRVNPRETVTVLAAGLLVWPVLDALARPKPLEPVRLAVGSRPGNIVYLQIDLALALGYFAEEGLNVSADYFDGGTGAAKALVSRNDDFSANSIDHAITMRASGEQLKMIASFTSLPTVSVVVQRDLRTKIRSIGDLKGKRIGVTAIGAGTHVLTASILKKAGYSLSDVTIVPVGSGDSLIQAMKRRDVEVALSSDPTTTSVLMGGDASLLLDLVTFEETQRIFTGGYQFTGLLTRPEVIDTRGATAQRMVNAIVRTNRFIATHSGAEIAARLPAKIVQDRYIFVKGLQHSRACFPRDSMVTLAGVANNLQSQIAFGSIKPQPLPDPASFFDMRFVLHAPVR